MGGGGKLSPRQKMINMMYLVLIALLALNVSKEVLNAFVLINHGLERTTSNFGEKNAKIYDNFVKAECIYNSTLPCEHRQFNWESIIHFISKHKACTVSKMAKDVFHQPVLYKCLCKYAWIFTTWVYTIHIELPMQVYWMCLLIHIILV